MNKTVCRCKQTHDNATERGRSNSMSRCKKKSGHCKTIEVRTNLCNNNQNRNSKISITNSLLIEISRTKLPTSTPFYISNLNPTIILTFSNYFSPLLHSLVSYRRIGQCRLRKTLVCGGSIDGCGFQNGWFQGSLISSQHTNDQFITAIRSWTHWILSDDQLHWTQKSKTTR